MSLGILALVTSVALFIPGQAPESALASLDALILAGKYADAEQAARRQLATLDAQNPESTDVVPTINRLVEAIIRQGRTDEEVERLVTRAMTRAEVQQPRTREHAGALRNRGWLAEARGQIPPAIRDYEQALEIMRETAGPEDPATVMTQKDVAMVNRTGGNYAKARSLLQEALAIAVRRRFSEREIAVLRHNLGAVHWDLGEYTAARDSFVGAVAGLRNALGGDHPIVAMALEGLGVIQVSLGNYTEGADALRQTLAIREKSLPRGHPDIGSALVNLADLMMTMGDYPEAKALLERALAIWEKALGRDNPQLVIALTNLAVTRERLGDRAGARAAFERGIALREKAHGPDDPTLVIPLTQLANVISDGGDLAAARPLYARARAIGERSRGVDHPYVASAALAEGQRLAASGNLASARPLLERADRIRKMTLGAEHPDVAAAVEALARLDAAQGRDREAIERALHAERIARQHFRETAATLSERQALLYGEERTRAQDLAILVAARATVPPSTRDLETLWDTVIRSRALVLDEMAWRGRVAASIRDADVQQLADELADARARLAQLFVRGPASDAATTYAKELKDARDAKDRAEERLAAKSAVHRQRLARADVGLDDVRDALPPGRAIVSYVRYASDLFAPPAGSKKREQFAYAAFILSGRDDEPRIVPLGPAAPIDKMVTEWRRVVRTETTAPAVGAIRRERLYRQTAARLRRLIWDPVAERLGAAKFATIVPDGALHLVDFSALPVNGSQYLVETGPTLHYASAERDVLAGGERARKGTGLLAVGSPAFDRVPATPGQAAARHLRSSCAAAGVRFAELPESGAEVNVIARLWRRTGEDALVLRGVDASEGYVKMRAPGHRVLHLATHGFVAGEGCRAETGARGAAGAPETLDANPLLGAGLVLAGASRASRPRGVDDGILTAEEISALDLYGVEWAVLSACDSGVGIARAGEGVFGLRRAFQVAGVETVIMSLWPVDDAQTRSWMEALYRARFEESRATPDAVRAASLAALTARRKSSGPTHPFYWSGFVAAGSWR